MNWFRKLRLRLRALFQKDTLDARMDDEMRSHIEMQTQENIEAGMKPEEARYAALRQFEWVECIKETCREQRGVSWIENLGQDVRYGARMLRKNPGFTVVAVITVALGIGTTSAVFSLIQGVLLTPPPYPKPERVILISSARTDGQPYIQGCAAGQWVEWQKATNSFKVVAAYEYGSQFLILPDGSESVRGMFVTPDYFKVIGVIPVLGREFAQSDLASKGGQATAIILGDHLWHRRFDGDPNIIGKTVHLTRRQPLTVLGVMPPGVRFLPSRTRATAPNYDVNAQVDFWIALWLPDLARPNEVYCIVAGRWRVRVTQRE